MKNLIHGIFPLTLSFVASASLASASEMYSLDQCYERALKQSETVAEQMELLVQADEHYSQSVGAMLPNISGSYQYQQQADIGNALGPLGSSIFPSNQPTGKVSLSQPLFRGLRDLATLKQKRQLQDVQKFAMLQAEVQLFNDLSQSFYNVLSYERDKTNYEEEIAANQKRLKDLSHFQKQGNAREADVLAIDTTIANLEADLENTKGLLKSARETLAFLTGLSPNIQLADTNSAPTSLQSIDTFVSHVDDRPDVISARSDLDASDQNVSVQKGAHLPSVDLTANYYFVRPGALDNVNWDAAVLLSIPIFSGGVTQSQVREAISQRSSKELAYNRARRQADTDIRSTYAVVEADIARVEKLQRAAKVAKKSYEVELRDYRGGLARNIDVLQASSADLDTQRALDRAVYALKTDFAKLQTASARWPEQLHPVQK